ncbi:MAG: Asp-tRNA(Asn)/Glu-tRNA(Gln) amidotransferase subunit GatB [Betaproteobacteria bacterium]|nr:MAG: Asp-tRNA(Asn)/Glu-tRNA(Gln) amidotransferase subunit GatB [Betaproteobacteria bacterium]
MSWEIVVGIETHAQLATRSKIFSGAATAFGAAPNTQASAVDIALPGVLPVLNGAAVECAIRFGIAVGGTINRRSVFARKNYFYPDLPKGYQISQYELPVVAGGSISLAVGDLQKIVRLTRAHLEEDAGKSLHEDFHGMTGIDLNRAGTPLLEIVSEPELRGAAEAVAYARAMHALVRWIGICDGNMQEGSFRCDANVSVRRAGDAALGTRCEIKNLNSFRFMEQAIAYEARRQIEILEGGGRIEQETRLFDPERNETRSMRSKEEAHDYRYFPDPDLLPLVLNEQDIDRIRSQMPELPEAMRERFMRDYELPKEMAQAITSSRETAEDFEAFWGHLLKLTANCDRIQGAQAANWVMMQIGAALNKSGLTITQVPISPLDRATLVSRIIDGTISHRAAGEVLGAMWSGEGTADAIIERRGLQQISDAGAIEQLVADVLAANPKSVGEFRAGKDKALNALVGQVMKASRGKANPAQVNALLRRKLLG